jgi:hypothetical protein
MTDVCEAPDRGARLAQRSSLIDDREPVRDPGVAVDPSVA